MTRMHSMPGSGLPPVLLLSLLVVSGSSCSDSTAPAWELLGSERGRELSASAELDPEAVDVVQIPSDLVLADWNGSTVRFWPYTGADLTGAPSDPVNLVFAGPVDPVELRAALLALDGDRSSFGFPDAPPFNARWADAIGDVQATYVEGPGWSGSEVQLALGDYGAARFHVRFFRAGPGSGSGGEWTLGAAHFEVLIPGTADHQVLSWERAEEIVTADLVRAGLLAPNTGPMPAGPYHAADGFRTIPSVLYNQLPADLIAYIQGPPVPVSQDVPIGLNGYATLFALGDGPAPAAGDFSQHLTFVYDQVIPKPFCSDGPADWVLVQGPVDLVKTVHVGSDGDFRYESRIDGRLTIVPVDITQSPPAPLGEPYTAEIGDRQSGMARGDQAFVEAAVRRIALLPGGTEMQQTRLRVGTHGRPVCLQVTKCPGI